MVNWIYWFSLVQGVQNMQVVSAPHTLKQNNDWWCVFSVCIVERVRVIHNRRRRRVIIVCLQNAWVWCESETVAIEQPSPGLPFSFFPYHKQDGYFSPLVPVRLLNLTGKYWMISLDACHICLYFLLSSTCNSSWREYHGSPPPK